VVGVMGVGGGGQCDLTTHDSFGRCCMACAWCVRVRVRVHGMCVACAWRVHHLHRRPVCHMRAAYLAVP